MANTFNYLDFGIRWKAFLTPDLQNNVITNKEFTVFIEGLEGFVLRATSAVPVSKVHVNAFQAVGTSATLDLTALDPGAFPNDDFTGLKVNSWAIKAGSTNNAAGVIVDGHTTNPYELFGGASDQMTFFPGMFASCYGNAKLAAVSATVKSVRFQLAVGDWVYYALAAG